MGDIHGGYPPAISPVKGEQRHLALSALDSLHQPGLFHQPGHVLCKLQTPAWTKKELFPYITEKNEVLNGSES